jgi:tricorn protease
MSHQSSEPVAVSSGSVMFSLLAAAALSRIQIDPTFNAGAEPLLLQHPTMNATTIVFEFADALWSVPKDGGRAVRLTEGAGVQNDPFFSPDGKWLAFSANYDGNIDVYVMPAEGGSPKRLTSHPAPDMVMGWTPNGKSVLFSSGMLSNTDAPRLFTVPVTGGFPTPLPLPNAYMGSYSPDGSHLAYVPHDKWETAWKRYRGGQTYPIWIADLSDSKVKAIPRENTNDEQPMWVGDKVFYLCDKRGPVGLFSYDVSSGRETEEIKGEGFDIKSATAGPGGIVYEKLGSIHIFDPSTKRSRRIPVSVTGDFTQGRTQFKNVAHDLSGMGISPSGSRVAVSARGFVMTVPAQKGDVHVLDDRQGVNRRDPAWSPDGKTVAYISDEKGEQQLALFDVSTNAIKLLPLGEAPGYYHNPTWSPDSSKLTYTDNKNSIWLIDVSSGRNVKVDSTIYDNPTNPLDASWSPDSNWLTYVKDLPNHLYAVWLYNVGSAKKTQITDGLANAHSPIFDLNGKYLYFFASTEVGQAASWLDLSSYNNPNEDSSVYAVVLHKSDPNPLQPESDEETPKEEPVTPPAVPKPGGPATAAPGGGTTPPSSPTKMPPSASKTDIDLDDIEHRIIALPLPHQLYIGLWHGPANSFFAGALPARANVYTGSPVASVWKFSFQDRKATPFAFGVTSMDVTPDGSKALLQGLGQAQIVSTMAPVAPGQGAVNLSDLTIKIDPKAEWTSMYHEVWRNERILFYSPTLNGIDSYALEKRYEPFLKHIESRTDLNYLFTDMLGELCVGHEFPGGGDLPTEPRVPGGLLGADYTFENHHYRLARIYDGERWNPGLYSPLAQPGINAKVGEYVLAIDGKDLTESTDIYDALEGKAGKQVKLKLGPTPDGKDSRVVTVVPVAQEFTLRGRAWEEDNRRYVLKMTGGRAGYVHVPDTNVGGWVAFNRYYYAHVGMDGMVVDERFNHGGLINDYMIREMQKTMDAAFKPRYGEAWPTPGAAIYGPKVLLANEYSGSGGDMFPWLFRHEKVGKIIGKRTWGGLIAAFGFQLVDGGHINSPDDAFFNPETNTWDVENWGVSPDIDVDLDPYKWRHGQDAQLDAAVAEINKELAAYKAPSLCLRRIRIEQS